MKLNEAVNQSVLAWLLRHRDATATKVLVIEENVSPDTGVITLIYYSHSNPTREVKMTSIDVSFGGLLKIIDLDLTGES